jgi:transposase
MVVARTEEALSGKFAELWPHLDERQWRLLLGAEARMLGRGGAAAVARAAGVSRSTVDKGVAELAAGAVSDGRVRRPGAGRKPVEHNDPGLAAALEELVDPATRGDPCSPLRWTAKSTATLADELTGRGHEVGARTVARLLKNAGYSLQANSKTVEGRQHPDRDAQFAYLGARAAEYLADGQPVVSVDTKKKELVANFKNAGREWQPTGQPVAVGVHDFPDPQVGKAIPYGVDDIAANTGWVSVGTDHDTAAFAVATLRRWWQQVGQPTYPDARRLLISADAGGSNGYRLRAWKSELAAFAADTGLAVTVSHLPPGTSKWNKIEHRLFSAITMNWRGRPLESHEVVVDLIGATTTRTGLKVHAELDPASYPKGVKITNRQMAALSLTRHDFHGDWNYTLTPNPTPRTTPM